MTKKVLVAEDQPMDVFLLKRALAIRRIERGTYGFCELTGEPIEAERLKAIPWTRYSISGQSEMEKTAWMRKYALPSLELLSELAQVAEEESETEEPNKNGKGSMDLSG